MWEITGECSKRDRREKPPTAKADLGAAATKFCIFGLVMMNVTL
jgi:hypothetical protein